MIKQRKIHAFTLMELSVVLVLTFFLVGIMYISYQIIWKQTSHKKSVKYAQLLMLKSELEMSFFFVDSIKANDDDDLIFSYKDKVSTYIFSDSTILRKKENKVDTLFSGIYTKRIVHPLNGSSYINKLGLTVKNGDETFDLSFSKKYRPNILLRGKEIDFEY